MQRRFSELLTNTLIDEAGIESVFPSGNSEYSAGLDPVLTGISFDSRTVQPGHMYFALPGLHTDGHRYIAQAIDSGASVVFHQDKIEEYIPDILYIQVTDSRYAMAPVSAAFYDNPSRDLAVIGVTGTEGKSTTVYLIYQLLELSGRKAGFLSTVQHKTTHQIIWNPEHQTTPEAPLIQAALAEMRDAGMQYAVLEASSHGLSAKTNRLGKVLFDIGVLTNITHEHLEFHGSWEQYRDDKANLFRILDTVTHEKNLPSHDNGRELQRIPSFAVSNADDPSTAYCSALTGRRTYTYSMLGNEADIMVKSLESSSDGNRYTVQLRASEETIIIQDQLPGAFNASNVMAALLTVSGLLDMPLNTLIPLVEKLQPVRGRMTPLFKGQPFEVLIDYAHTPSSFETVLPPLKKRIEAYGGRLISLFGSGGERDTAKRPRQGRIAADWSDIVVLTDEDPRGEDPMALLEDIAAGCPEKPRNKELFLIPDRVAAIRKAFSMARNGDIVLLLGKGHENSIIYADSSIPYDEIGTAESVLAEMGYKNTDGEAT